MLSLIPISDTNPARRKPFITFALIALNVVVFLRQPDLGSGQDAIVYFYDQAPVPCQLLDGRCPPFVEDPGLGPFVWSMIFSTFLHGGFLHIAGNMLFLWVFGNNIEDYLHHVKFLAFYLAGGLFASLAHVLWTLRALPVGSPTHQAAVSCIENNLPCASPFVPSVGASGAVAAVMGAYLLLYPRARVRVLFIFFLITVIEMSALAVLGLWFVYQFLIAAQEFAGEVVEVAWMAHVGGFVFGLVAIFLLGGRPHRRQRVWQPGWRY